MKRMIAFLMMTMLLFSQALAAATPTPPPVAIDQTVEQPPKIIQDVLDIAYSEWEVLAGRALKQVNKFTEWRGKGIGFGWCGIGA